MSRRFAGNYGRAEGCCRTGISISVEMFSAQKFRTWSKRAVSNPTRSTVDDIRHEETAFAGRLLPERCGERITVTNLIGKAHTSGCSEGIQRNHKDVKTCRLMKPADIGRLGRQRNEFCESGERDSASGIPNKSNCGSGIWRCAIECSIGIILSTRYSRYLHYTCRHKWRILSRPGDLWVHHCPQ